MDDLSIGSTVNLKTSLCSSRDRSGPKNYHDRFNFTLPPENSSMQEKINNLDKFAKTNSMKINESKSAILPFNFTKKYDFLPIIKFPDAQKPLEVVYEKKLLGIICTSDGKWMKNTQHIVKKATAKLWMLRRLKWLGADKSTLLEAYHLHVRSKLEICVPLWHSSLTSNETIMIERVQKTAFAIILSSYGSYSQTLISLGEVSLECRRLELCKTFAKRCAQNPRHTSLFPRPNESRPLTRNGKPFMEYSCRKKRFYISAVPFLTRLLNDM